jgi:hypothetical protein
MLKTAKTFRVLSLVMIFLGLTSNLKAAPEDQLAPDGKPWITSSISYWTVDDPNLDPDWDWQQEFYEVYWDRPPAALWTVASPFTSEYTSGVALTLDYEPDDGWVLLARNFGSEKNHLKNPYFILYNKATGLLRVFMLLSVLEHYSTGSISLSFDPALSGTTALLSHVEPRVWAVDKYKKDLISYGITEVQNGHWTYADFVTAYDPNTENVEDSAIRFRLEGVNITDLKIKSTDFSLSQVLPKSGVPAEIDTYDSKDLVADGKAVIGYHNTFGKYKEQFKKAANRQTDETLKKDMTDLMESWIYKHLPFIGAGIGLVDLFIGGGRKHKPESPVPMVFSGDLTLTGTMTERNFIAGPSVRTPGAIHTNDNFVPLYDHPLGIINLTVTPIVRHAHYAEGCTTTQPFYKYYDEYRIVSPMSKDTHFRVNPYAGLKLKEMKAALVFRLPKDYETNPRSLPYFSAWMNAGNYEVESSTDGKYILRTRYIPFYLLRYATVYAPPGTDVSVKVKAVLERIDAPEGTQPVLFVAEYNPDVYTSCHYSAVSPNWSPYQLRSYPDTSSAFDNGDFQLGLSYWETYGDGNEYGTAEEGGGHRSAYIARGSATNQFLGLVQRSIACEPNTTYRLSLLLKTRADGGAAAAGLGNWGSPNSHQDFGWTGSFTDWQQISGTWTSSDNERSLDVVLYGTPDFSGEAFFRDVLLEKVGPASIAADIEGPSFLGFKELGTYSADVRFGSGNYPYQWYQQEDGSLEWYPLGTGRIQNARMIDRDFTLKVEIQDNQTGQVVFATIHVEYGDWNDIEPRE